MALTREVIVAAGLDILDRYGLGDLSMRRVAEHLGVQVGALYYHVPNKQSLLTAIALEIVAGVAHAPGGVEQWGRALREQLLQHRDGAEIVASAAAMALDPRLGEMLSAPAGVPHSAAVAVRHFVLSFVTAEQTQQQLGELGVLPMPSSAASEFDAALRVIGAGAATIN